MLSLTRKADYAVMAMAELARRAPSRVSARELAASLRVPQPVLTGVLHRLRLASLVGSTLGGKGGYSLARDADTISLADMVEAIEGPMRLALCCGEDSPGGHADAAACDLEPDCRIKEPVQRIHRSLRRFLAQVRLRHLAFGDDSSSLGLEGVLERVGGASGCSCDGSRSGADRVDISY